MQVVDFPHLRERFCVADEKIAGSPRHGQAGLNTA
jgi:hypothetical protein